MTKKMTTEEWIEKAKRVHGDKYDYSESVYVNGYTKVRILCHHHGPFEQLPRDHLKGCGCRECSGKKRWTAKSFIQKSKETHGQKYDYSKVEYKNVDTKVCIICPVEGHGEFYQRPKNHMKGEGCPSCGGKKRKTTEEFIQDAHKIHRDKYDYSKVNYVNSSSKVCIICPIEGHGEFFQAADYHLQGYGCPNCNIKKKLDRKEFIRRSKETHGDKYDYSNVVFINATTKVEIICPEHGPFSQKPYKHYGGQDCPECSLTKNRKKVTYNEWLSKVKQKHGDRYDYSRVIFTEDTIQTDVVEIGCPIHGFFKQTLEQHTHYGCAECAGVKPYTLEKFISKANKKHNSKFDYSKVKFSSLKDTVEIICPIHGKFEQKAKDHLDGYGCSECSGTKKHTKESFIKKAKSIHGDKYDYSNVKYKNTKTKVDILCKKHNFTFSQTPNSHLMGAGCPKCNKCMKYATESWIEAATEKHNGKYDYSKVDYKLSSIPVTIICPNPEHRGFEFEQAPAQHLSGQGCPKCAGVYHYKSTEEWITEARKVHNDKYDYSLTEYVNNKTKVIIICPLHGKFEQTPNAHILGSGCNKCSYSVSKVELQFLDSLGISEENRQYPIIGSLYKADGYDPETNTVYELYGDFWHGNPDIYDLDDINPMTKTTYRELYENTMKREEEIKNHGYKVVAIWEADFMKSLKDE